MSYSIGHQPHIGIGASPGAVIASRLMPEDAQKTPDAQRALMNAAGIADRARTLEDRLATLHSRLFGPTPTTANDKLGGPSNGFFADLISQHDAADGALCRAVEILSQIERAFP